MAAELLGFALAAAKPLAESIGKLATETIARKLKEHQAAKTLVSLKQRAKEISQVKTLLNLEKPVMLTEFYSPQIIEIDGEKGVTADGAELEQYTRLIVSGVAGQGKSTLFRYLALSHLARQHLPLLIELKNYANTPDLTTLLSHELDALGFTADPEVHGFLLKTAPVVILLDAFDEVPTNLQSLARAHIEALARKYPAVRILVSSRPSLEIQSSGFFRVSRLALLQKATAIAALRKMAGPKDKADAIEKALDNEANAAVVQMLTTPLMVALLLLHHRLTNEFPQTLQSFYGDLFEVLFKRHDQMKALSRSRKSTASENELRELFGYVCFVTRKEGFVESHRTKFIDACETGKTFFGKSYAADLALDDIMERTNLILADGSICRYAHKLIQEFYGARFLSRQPEENVAQFLQSRIRGWGDWRQFLEFFELLEGYQMCKHFLLPHVGWIAYGNEEKRIPANWQPSKEAVARIFGKDVIGMLVNDSRLQLYSPRHESVYYGFRYLNESVAFRAINVIQRTKIDWPTVAADPNCPKIPVARQDSRPDLVYFSIAHLLNVPGIGDQLRQVLESAIKQTVPAIIGRYELFDHRKTQTGLFE